MSRITALHVILRTVSSGVVLTLLVLQIIHFLHREVMPQRHLLTIQGLFTRDRFEMLEALPDGEMYAHYMELQGLKTLRADSTSESVVLTVLNNGTYMFLGGREQLRDVDPRLLPFYRAETLQEARAHLRGFGVTHIYTTPHAFPTRTNSYIDVILSDPQLSTRIYESALVHVYRLK